MVYLSFDAVAQLFTDVQLLAQPLQVLVVGSLAGSLDGLQGCQGHLQLQHLARRDASNGHLRDDALQVADAVQLVIDALTELRLAIVVIHDVKPLVDGFLVFQREHQPSAQHSASHRAHRLVDHIEQRLAVFLHRMDQLQRADGELVETDILILLNARD